LNEIIAVSLGVDETSLSAGTDQGGFQVEPVVEEIMSQDAFDNFFKNVVRKSGAEIDSAGAFIDGPRTDNGILFKAAKITFVDNTPIKSDLKNIMRIAGRSAMIQSAN
jgi:hypothetical protein